MTASRRRFVASALVAPGVSALALSSAIVMPSRAEGPDAAAVADAVVALTKAMLAADRVKLEALTADQLSYGHSSGKVEDKATFVDVVASKKTVYKSIELSKQTIVVAGNDAIVRHAWESESGTGDGKWNVSKIGVLQVWQKQPSGWRLLARQAFKV